MRECRIHLRDMPDELPIMGIYIRNYSKYLPFDGHRYTWATDEGGITVIWKTGIGQPRLVIPWGNITAFEERDDGN